MKDEYRELKEDVLDEEKAIEETLERLSTVRIEFNSKVNNFLTEPAMGTYLMNFYNGIENILKRITKEYYLAIPKGASWHKELLGLSYDPPPGKITVFNQGLVEKLHPYRNGGFPIISI